MVRNWRSTLIAPLTFDGSMSFDPASRELTHASKYKETGSTKMSGNHEEMTLRRPSFAFGLLLKLLPGAIIAVSLALVPHQHQHGISSVLKEKLQLYGVPETRPHASFADSVDQGYHAFEVAHVHDEPDTTAVLLNWSRLDNVILLSSLLCGPWLETVIANVIIWNNNPKVTLNGKVSRNCNVMFMFLLTLMETFAGTGCSSRKLRIINASQNLLFQARFLACAEANTPYCFFQVSWRSNNSFPLLSSMQDNIGR